MSATRDHALALAPAGKNPFLRRGFARGPRRGRRVGRGGAQGINRSDGRQSHERERTTDGAGTLLDPQAHGERRPGGEDAG
jgi:hypothetical protein